MFIRPSKVNKTSEYRTDGNPKNGLVQSRFGGNAMCLFMKQAQVQQHKYHDDGQEYAEKNSLSFIATEKRKEKYVQRVQQMILDFIIRILPKSSQLATIRLPVSFKSTNII